MKTPAAKSHMKMAELEDETNTIESRIKNSNGDGGCESGAKKSLKSHFLRDGRTDEFHQNTTIVRKWNTKKTRNNV